MGAFLNTAVGPRALRSFCGVSSLQLSSSMDVESSVDMKPAVGEAADAGGSSAARPSAVVELEAFSFLLVLVHLIDQKAYAEVLRSRGWRQGWAIEAQQGLIVAGSSGLSRASSHSCCPGGALL